MKRIRSNRFKMIAYLSACIGASLLGFVLGGSNIVVAEKSISRKSTSDEPVPIQESQPSDDKVAGWLGIFKQDTTNRPFTLRNFTLKILRSFPIINLVLKR